MSGSELTMSSGSGAAGGDVTIASSAGVAGSAGYMCIETGVSTDTQSSGSITLRVDDLIITGTAGGEDAIAAGASTEGHSTGGAVRDQSGDSAGDDGGDDGICKWGR